MKQGKCTKCKQETWLEEHHILPTSIFGKNKFIVYLCPNCHTDFHQKIPLTSKNKDYYLGAYLQWILGTLSIIILILMVFYAS